MQSQQLVCLFRTFHARFLESHLVTKTKGKLRLIRFLQYFHKEVLVARDPPANGETLCAQEERYYFLAAKSMRIYLLIVIQIVSVVMSMYKHANKI